MTRMRIKVWIVWIALSIDRDWNLLMERLLLLLMRRMEVAVSFGRRLNASDRDGLLRARLMHR